MVVVVVGGRVWELGRCLRFSSPIIGSSFLEVPASLFVFPFAGSNQGSDVPKCEQVLRGMIVGSTRGFRVSNGRVMS